MYKIKQHLIQPLHCVARARVMSTPRDRLAQLASTYGATISARRYVSSSIHVNKSSVRLAASAAVGRRVTWLDLYASDTRDGALDIVTISPALATEQGIIHESCLLCDNELGEESYYLEHDGFEHAQTLWPYPALGAFARHRVVHPEDGNDSRRDVVTALCNNGTDHDVYHSACLVRYAFTTFLDYNQRLRVCQSESSNTTRDTLRFDHMPEQFVWSLCKSLDTIAGRRNTTVTAYHDRLVTLGSVYTWAKQANLWIDQRISWSLTNARMPPGLIDAVYELRSLLLAPSSIANIDETALELAALNGRIDEVRYLVQRGADVRANNDHALRYAAQNGHIDVVRYLVEHGADVNAYDDVALRSATEDGHIDVVRYLVEHGANVRAGDDEALRAAAENGRIIVVRYLVEHGANVRAVDDEALRYAARLGHIDVVRYLVEHDADVNAMNDAALRGAARLGHIDVVRYLVEHGVNVHAEDDWALRYAAQNGHIDVVRYLVEHDANVHAEDDWALRYAAQNGHIDVVRYLVEHDADVHARDDEALQWAAEEGQIDVVRYLVEHGANINAVDLDEVNDDIRTYINGLQPNVKRARNRGQLALMSRLRI